jgi:UDP-N-acetylmuramate dehydrogenase
MNSAVATLESALGQGRIKQNELLVGHTILKREVTAEFYTEVEKTEDLIKAVQTAQRLGIAYTVFGTGSKIIFNNEYTSGLVIKNNSRRFDVVSMKGKIIAGKQQIAEALVHADAGVLVNQLVRFTLDEGFAGLECFLGTNGTVGGAMYYNMTYPPERVSIWAQVHALRILTADGQAQMYVDKIDFFRKSKFFQNNKAVLLSVIFRLLPSDKKLLWQRGEEALQYRNKETR